MSKNVLPVLAVVYFLPCGALAQSQRIVLNAPPPPAVTSVSAQPSASGLDTYCEWVIAIYPIGKSAASSPACVSKAGGSVAVNWSPAGVGVTGYDVLRTTSPSLPTGAALLAVATNVACCSQTDSLGALSSYTLQGTRPAKATIRLDNQANPQPTVYVDTPFSSLAVGTTTISPTDGVINLVRRGIVAEYRMTDAIGTVLPDSSGNGNDGTLVAAPTVTAAGVAFNGTTQRADLPVGVTAQVVSACAYADNIKASSSLAYSPLVGTSATGGFNLFQGDGQAAYLNTHASLFYGNTPVTTAWASAAPGPEYVCVVLDAATDHIYVSGVESPNYKVQGGSLATARVGTLSIAASVWFALYTPATFYHVSLYSVALTAAEVQTNYQAVSAILQKRGTVPFTPSPYYSKDGGNPIGGLHPIVCDGDSITLGMNGATPPCSQMAGMVDATISNQITNLGIGGEALSIMLHNAAMKVDPLYNTQAKRNLVIIFGGTNDIGAVSTPLSTYQILAAYCMARRKAGWNVIVVPMISRTGISGGNGGATMDSLKNSYNALIMSGWPTFADAVIDPTGIPLLYADNAFSNPNPTACAGGPCFQPDGIHPTTAGGALLGAAYVNAINGLAGRAGRYVQATDPGCTLAYHVGRQWFNITTTTTSFMVCMNVAGTVQWVAK